MTGKQIFRLTLLVIGWAVYGVVLVYFAGPTLGPAMQQAASELVSGKCAQFCDAKDYVQLLAIALPIVVTGPGLIWLGIVWLKREGRTDTQVKEIDGYFAKSPERVLPPDIDDTMADPDHYRDRRGRVRRPAD